MALKTEAYYRAVGGRAVERLGVTEPPVPIDQLVASYGIPVRPVALPEFFTAATVYEDGLPVFLLNWNKTEAERTQALAHMLAHVLLVLEGEPDGYARTAAQHTEADSVAHELLLPTQMVIEQSRLWFNDYRYLARLFAVDEREMLDRLRGLGLVKGPEGAVWDF